MSEDIDTTTEEGNDNLEDQPEDVEEKPEIEDEATVEVDLEAVDDALEEDVEDDDQEESDDEPEQVPTEAPSGQTFGDMYVTGLVTVSNTVIDSYGADEANGVDESVARDLGLDDAMDEWIREKGGTEDLPPGQALMIGTAMFGMAVLASNPEVVAAVMEGFEA